MPFAVQAATQSAALIISYYPLHFQGISPAAFDHPASSADFENAFNRGWSYAYAVSLFVDKSRMAELSGFGVEVADAAGRAPKITRYHDALTGEKSSRERIVNPDDPPIVISSGGDMVLDPGKTLHLRMNVARLFDLKEPGQYSIRVKRTDPASGAPVMSNVLKITSSDRQPN